MARYSQDFGMNSMDYWGNPPPGEENAHDRGQGMKRDESRGEADRGKRNRRDRDRSANDDDERYRQDQDDGAYGAGDFGDAFDSSWVEEENKRLAKEYGGYFITVRPLQDQPGKVGYHCELCRAEMNAKKSLDLHCSGMKHLKKKNTWEQNQGYDSDNHNENRQTHEPRGRVSPATYRDHGREGYSDRDRWGLRAEPYDRYRDHYDYNTYDRRPRYDQGSYSRPERSHSPRYERRSEAEPYPSKVYGRRSPPAAHRLAGALVSPSTKEGLSEGPTGILIKRLADCSVKCQADAELAMEVITLLFKCLKDFHQKRGSTNAIHLISEAEIKFNIMKELQEKPQPTGVSSQMRQQTVGVTSQMRQNDSWGAAYSNEPNPNPLNPSGTSADYRQGDGKVQYSAPPFRFKGWLDEVGM